MAHLLKQRQITFNFLLRVERATRVTVQREEFPSIFTLECYDKICRNKKAISPLFNFSCLRCSLSRRKKSKTINLFYLKFISTTCTIFHGFVECESWVKGEGKLALLRSWKFVNLKIVPLLFYFIKFSLLALTQP